MLTVLLFLLVLSVLVLVHEAGHFFAARAFGVGVDEFGVGFPPRAWSVRRGGTVYSVNWIPLGGFVRLKDEEADARAKDSFRAQTLARRLLVIAAGVVMNVALCAVLLSVGYGLGMPQELLGPPPSGAVLRDRSIQVGTVFPDTPAAVSGFAAGDALLALDGAPLASADDFRARIATRGGSETAIVVRRAGTETTLRVTPVTLKETGRPGIGIGLFETATVSYPWRLAPVAGVRATAAYAADIVKAFGGLLFDLVRTGAPGEGVAGPVGIAVLTGRVAGLGAIYLLQFVALLSLNLGIINLLPIPALDGGRVLFLAIEKLRGRRLPVKMEMLAHQAGFAVLLLLVALVTVHDVLRLFR